MGVFTDLIKGFADNFYSGEERRNIIQKFLPYALEEGYTGAAALRAYQNVGLGIRQQDFYAIHNQILGVQYAPNYVRFVGRDNRPNPDRFGVLRVPQEEKYMFVGKVEFYDPKTGDRWTQGYMIQTNKLGTRREIEEEILSAILADTENYPYMAENIALLRAYKNG